MPSEYSFSAQDWIKEHLHDGVHLDPECLQALQNFTLMWNIFESLLCDNSASVCKFGLILAKWKVEHLPPEIQQAFAYFQNRYVTTDGFSHHFKLQFRRNDCREMVENALKSAHNDASTMIYVLLIIIYRLRNNLFHGLKNVSSLNSQTANLNIAARTLAVIIELHGHPALIRSTHAASR
jgi:hypothetical protein